MLKLNFEIDNNIYPIDLINQAISDFQEVSNITLNNNILTIEDENPEIIFSELINYVLALYNQLN